MAGRALVAAGLDARAVRLLATPATCGVAVVDYGCKRSILRRLAAAGAAVTVYPHDADADELARYDGVAALERARRPGAARRRGRSRCASCSAACRCSASASATSCSRSPTGHETFKLPFGHRGANHPVLERATGRVLVTSQNHGFAVEAERGARGDARLALRRHRRGPRLPGAARALGAVPSRGGPGPARRVAAHRASGSRSCACRGGATSTRSA